MRCQRAATSFGMISPAAPRRLKRASRSSDVGCGFTCTTVAPRAAASRGTCAAGKTTDEVPTLNSTSQLCAASKARVISHAGNASPNHTTPGRNGPPHDAQRGGSIRRPPSGSFGTLTPNSAPRPQSKQRGACRLPCWRLRRRFRRRGRRRGRRWCWAGCRFGRHDGGRDRGRSDASRGRGARCCHGRRRG